MGDRERVLVLENTADVMLHETISIGRNVAKEVEHVAHSSMQEHSSSNVSEEAIKDTENAARQAFRSTEHIVEAFGQDLSNCGKEVNKSWEKEY